MEERNYKNRHVGLTIWTWSLQFIIWISLFLCLLSKYYDNKFIEIDEKYPEYHDENGVPYYYINWDKNKMKQVILPAFIIFIIAYIAYLIAEFYSTSFSYLYHKKGNIMMYQKMKELFCGHPIIKFNCVCYHFETYTVYYTDSNGNSRTRTETRRVNTHYDSFIVPYYSVRDISGPFVLDIAKGLLKKKDYVKLKLILIIDWADAISLSDYENYKSDFIERNKNYDKYMDFTEERTLPGFNTYNLVLINEKELCTIHVIWYFLLTILTLVQYYKWYIESKCIHQSFKIVKLVSTRYNLIEKEEYIKKQPKLDLINKIYDFELSTTCFCEDKNVDLPTLNEIEDAANKYGNKLKNYNETIDSNDDLNLNEINEDYKNKITISIENTKEDSETKK